MPKQKKVTLYRWNTTCSVCKEIDNAFNRHKIDFDLNIVRDKPSYGCNRCKAQDISWEKCTVCIEFNARHESYKRVKKLCPKSSLPIITVGAKEQEYYDSSDDVEAVIQNIVGS